MSTHQPDGFYGGNGPEKGDQGVIFGRQIIMLALVVVAGVVLYRWFFNGDGDLLGLLRACSDFGFEASMSKFCFKEGKICSCSRVPTAKILTHFKIKFAVRSPKSEIRTSSKPIQRS